MNRTKRPAKGWSTGPKPKVRRIRLTFTVVPNVTQICDELLAQRRNTQTSALYLALDAASAEALRRKVGGDDADPLDRLRFEVRDAEVSFPRGRRKAGPYQAKIAPVSVDRYRGFLDRDIGNLKLSVAADCRGSGTLTLYEHADAAAGSGRL